MASPLAKANKKLARRRKWYDENITGEAQKAFRRPGSTNRRKQG